MAKNKLLLMILDGVGIREASEYNAVKNANMQHLRHFFNTRPWTTLVCHGRAVGLPEGVMGNSEVGHVNIGAGRVVMQDLVRIDVAFEQNTFATIPEFMDVMKYVKTNGTSLHLLGLLSDAGVHSDYRHLKNMLHLLKKNGITNVYLHAITDGRDTPPNSGIDYIRNIIEFMKQEGIGKLATIIGRYYAMDRDKRWDRVQIAYDCLTTGAGTHTDDAIAAMQTMYQNKITDEFISPIVIDDHGKSHLFQDGDAVLTFNFRADRMREIAIALNFDDFNFFPRAKLVKLFYTTMKKYREDFPFPVIFKDEVLKDILGEVISKAGMTQLRIAETEKYAHVTYFFNGGEEKLFAGEDRILIPSPRIATYDLQPEMSAPEVAEKLLAAIHADKYDVIILNFANGDMVGHSGIYEAAVKALENVDIQIGKIVSLFLEKGGTVFITADHGNSEEMWDFKNNQPHTQHTLNPVPFIVITPDQKPLKLRADGKLSDIAPTMLRVLQLPQPALMTGKSLIIEK